jgi:hypothetical protein
VPGRVPLGNADALRDLVRDVLPGYRAQDIAYGAFSLSRTYVPADASRSGALDVTVERYRDRVSAQRRIAEWTKRRYPSGGVAVTAAGLDGYFGVSAQRAVLALDDSGVLLTLETHATGIRPKELRADLVSVAESLLD